MRKPRTAIDRPFNKLLSKQSKEFIRPEHCPYDDGTKWKECNYPWSNKCDGNIFKCTKLKLQHNASLGPNSENKKDFI